MGIIEILLLVILNMIFFCCCYHRCRSKGCGRDNEARQLNPGTQFQEIKRATPREVEEHIYHEITVPIYEYSTMQYGTRNADQPCGNSNGCVQFVSDSTNVRQENVDQNIYYISRGQLTVSASEFSNK